LSNLNDQSNSVPLKEYLLTIFAFEREMTDREKVFVTYVLSLPNEHCNWTMSRCFGGWIS
jgi:hypothetical protein